MVTINLKEKSFKRIINQIRMLIVLIAIVAFFSIFSPYFLKVKNLHAIGLTISIIGIVCIGQSIVLLSGGFDLSVGSVAGFSGMMVAYLTKNYGHYWVIFFVGLAIGTVIGLANGLLITKARINPLITTISMLSIYQGATFLVSDGFAISVTTLDFRFLGTTRVFGTPLPIIILIALYIVFFLILKYTVYGRYIYSIGGNAKASKLSGINVDKIRISVYTVCSMLSALGGIILTSRLGAALTTAGSGYPLNSIAGCVLGGISISGGEGIVFGSLIGVAIIGVIQTGLIMIGMPTYYQYIATGLILLNAVFVDTMKK